MNVAAPQSTFLRWLYGCYMLAFFLYLAAPLAGVFAFNDSLFPALPWKGFTLEWFFGTSDPKLGMFHDRRLMEGLWNSLYIGAIVSVLFWASLLARTALPAARKGWQGFESGDRVSR